MVVNSRSTPQEGPSASLRRHQSQCSICSHPQRQEIEDAWLNWANTIELAEKYRFDRHAFYRHAHALALFRERQKQRMRLYEKGLERLDLTLLRGPDLVKLLRDYFALCAGEEEAKQAASLPVQAVLDPVSVQEAEVSAENGSALEEPTPQPVPTVESAPAAEGTEPGEPVVTPLASPEAQILEAAVTNTPQ
jgi:hypothetical protein